MSANQASGTDEEAPWEGEEVSLYSTRPPPGDVHSAATTVAAVPDAILDGMKDPIVRSPSPLPPLVLPPNRVAAEPAVAIPAQALEEAIEGWQDLAPPIAAFDEPLALDDFERLEGGMLALPTIDVDMPLADLETGRDTL